MKRDSEWKISSCLVNSVLGAINSVLDLITHGGELEVEATPHPLLLSFHFRHDTLRQSRGIPGTPKFLLKENYVLVKAQISSFVDGYAKIISRLPYKFWSPHYTWFLINNLGSGTLVRIKSRR